MKFSSVLDPCMRFLVLFLHFWACLSFRLTMGMHWWKVSIFRWYWTLGSLLERMDGQPNGLRAKSIKLRNPSSRRDNLLVMTWRLRISQLYWKYCVTTWWIVHHDVTVAWMETDLGELNHDRVWDRGEWVSYDLNMGWSRRGSYRWWCWPLTLTLIVDLLTWVDFLSNC